MLKYFGNEVKIMLVKENEQAQECFIKRSSDVYDLVKSYLECIDREVFIVVALSSSNKVLGVNEVSIGNIDSAIVSGREVFKPLILQNAKSFIMIHNHPSGNISPSQQDKTCTDSMKKIGELFETKLLDHVIIGQGRFFSFSDENIL